MVVKKNSQEGFDYFVNNFVKKPAKAASKGGPVVTYRGGSGSTASSQDTGSWSDDSGGGGGGGGGYDAYAAANAAARAQSQKQNEQTRALADAKYALLGSFGKQRDTKLANIAAGLAASDLSLLENYRTSNRGLQDTLTDNEKAQADSSYKNILNTLRERSDIQSEVASQGAGETDILRSQLSALRNYDANQGEINRSFFDTERSTNRAITGLNVETVTGRKNLFDRAEDDRDAAHTNYQNQVTDMWNEILNIENSNTNVDSDSSEAYQRKYTNAAAEMSNAAANSYTKKTFDPAMKDWDGKGQERERKLTSNKAQVISLGGGKRAEGATLRKW